MSWIDGLRHKLRTLLRANDYDREIDEELRFHQDLAAMNAADREEAIRRFGNRTYHKEEARRMTWLAWLDTVQQDATYAWRSILRTPGVTAMIVVTLALGIGVNGAVFSVLDQLFLRNPSGVVEPEGLRRIWTKYTRTPDGTPAYSRATAYPQYKRMAEAWGGEDRLAVMTQYGNFRLGGKLTGPATNILFTTGNYWTLLGVRPAMGRFFTDAESRPGTVTQKIVVSNGYWKSTLGADTAIIGKRIKLDTLEFEVIGVAPANFNGVDLRATTVWAPLGALPRADQPSGGSPSVWLSPRRSTFWTFGRIDPKRTYADFERLATTTNREANKQIDGPRADSLSTIHAASIIEARGPATATQEQVLSTRLMGVAIIILIIACANVVNLMLARAVNRKREIAVRLAMGISRSRLIRLITIESVLLALCAAVAALFTAWWGGSLLRSQLMAGVVFAQPTLHAHVVWATIGVALGCGLIAGVIPAVQFSRPQLTADLKDNGRSSGKQRSRLRDGLVVAQAALSVMLLVGAALFVRTLKNIENIDIGFDAGRVLFADVRYNPGEAPPIAERIAKIAEVEERLQGRAGIEMVGRTAMTPMGGFSFWTFWWGSDSSASLSKEFPVAYAVGSKFFAASGMRLLKGRTFDDGAAGEGQVMVNDALAKVLWPEGEALGQCIRFQQRAAPCHLVTGVVSTASRGELIERPQPQYYLPIGTKLTEGMGGWILVVRTRPGAEEAASREVRAMLKQALPMGEAVITPMTEVVEPKYRPWRLGAKLFTGVGVLALLVALVGIYSTVAYSVGQRTHEFGVRVALGAKLGDVLNQVVGEGMRVVVFGIALGVVLTMVTSRLVASLLYGVEPNDISAMMLAGSTLLLVAIAASLVPAWRAARVDPVRALRRE